MAAAGRVDPTMKAAGQRAAGGRRCSALGAAVVLIATVVGAERLEAATGNSATATPRVPARLHLVADLSERKLRVLRGNRTAAVYRIAIGEPEHPTPTGTFRIARIVWNPQWNPPPEQQANGKTPQPAGARANPMRLVKIFFREPDYYIHGTNDPASIGDALSHGCVRMEPNVAYRLARTLMRYGGAPRSTRWFRHVLRVRSATRTIRLRRPVAMEIIG
jgi:lipoprotein-anchoring transpeptidase ErfK/SrfK